MNRESKLGILLVLSGLPIVLGSLIIVFLDSIGYWGYPKNFIQALFCEPAKLSIGLQFFHYFIGGTIFSALGVIIIILAITTGQSFIFEPWAFAYLLLGKRVQKIMPHFKDLHNHLKKGGVNIAFSAYVSFMFLMSIIVFIVSIIGFAFFWPIILHISFFSVENLLLSLMFAGLTSVLTIMLIYIYPGIKSSNRRIPIEVNLPYISSFLTLLSSSNVPPRTIFHSLAKVDTLREVHQEFSNIVRDVEVFGQDLLSSILENTQFTPNEKLKETLNGYVATIRTGGNPTEYLRVTTENVMKEKMVKLDLMLESLSALAEIYIMVLVAMPLLFVVMFATLGMLGGGGTMNPVLILYILLYLGIPILATILIIVISTMTVL